MQFEAEVKSAGFKTKMVKEGPAVTITEIRLVTNPGGVSLDEIQKMVNQPVRVELSKVQLSLGEPYHDLTKTPALQLAPPKTTKKVRRKSALRD